MGTLCNTKNSELQIEQECIATCRELGITYLGQWNGPGDFPNCTFTEGLKVVCRVRHRVCPFNTSPIPGRTNVNPTYATICKKIDYSGTLKKRLIRCNDDFERTGKLLIITF